MRKHKKLFFLLLAFFFSCASQSVIMEEPEPIPIPSTEPPDLPSAFIAADYLTIVAVGDNIIHDPILGAAFRNGAYNFEPFYGEIKKYVIPADIAFVNQETILGNSTLGYSGYPLFSSPPEAGSALAAAGFSVVNQATNHAMDRGEAGILSTIAHWDSIAGLSYLGIHRSEEERQNRRVIIEKNNFKVGFLSYTYGTNGIPLPKDKPYMVSLTEPDKMSGEIDALRPLCDYLVVSMHWGEEYLEEISENQRKMALLLAEHKVDLVIGHHPHVLEPFAIHDRSDGGTMTVFYSLGNFLSAHARPAAEVLLGGLMYIRLKKTGDEIITEEAGLIPLVTHYEADYSNMRVYPLSEYSEDFAEKHRERRNNSQINADFFNKKAGELFGPGLILRNPFLR